jgi:hypothetical protein
MIYRRAAVRGIYFDELLPTYGGEDRDFSMRVAQHCRLLIVGDLLIKHHYTRQGRDSGLNRLRESSFGAGRRFAKYSAGLQDHLIAARTALGDFLVDVIAFLRHPVHENFMTIGSRISGFRAGLRSVRNGSSDISPCGQENSHAATSSLSSNG